MDAERKEIETEAHLRIMAEKELVRSVCCFRSSPVHDIAMTAQAAMLKQSSVCRLSCRTCGTTRPRYFAVT